jgi:hypothetical protein
MNNILKSAIAAVALVGSAHAGSVSSTNISVGSGDLLIENNGAFLSSGSASAGYFNAGFDVAAAVASQNFGALVQNFNVLASAQIGDTTNLLGANVTGYYAIGDTDYGAPGARTGAVLYTFFTTATALSSANAGSDAFGLVQSSLTIDAETFPPDSNSIVVSNGTDATGVKSTVLLGTVTPGTADLGPLSTGPTSVNGLNLVSVPEPSVALLGLLGLAGLVRRRR